MNLLLNDWAFISPSIGANLIISGYNATALNVATTTLNANITSKNTVAVHPEERQAIMLKVVDQELFDKLVITPSNIDFGVIASDSAFTVKIWNTSYTYRTTIQHVLSNDESVVISNIGEQHILFPGEYTSFIATALKDGPPVLASTIDLTTDAYADSVKIQVSGLRSLVLSISPDWSSSVAESITYKTAVITSYNGAEQRSRLMAEPTVKFEYTLTATDSEEVLLLEDIVYDKQADVICVPVWHESTVITSAAINFIYCNTAYARFKAARYALVYRDYNDYALVAVKEVDSSGLALKYNFDTSKANNALIIPVEICYMSDSIKFDVEHKFASATLEFTVAK